MADEFPPIDPKLVEFLEQTNKALSALTEEVTFLLALNAKTNLILIRIAHMLERVSNIVYDAPDEEPIDAAAAETKFKEIRDLFDEQMRLMKGEADGDESA